ncbi:MAG: hypothetical protein L3J49_05835, partial [Desulfobulbaceae bacterium]|nr:hypothetical protein [Desulfobulbaceae bacterium]
FALSAFLPELEENPSFRWLEPVENGVKSCTVLLDSNRVPDTIKTLTGAGIKVYECAKIERPLEEVFTEIIDRENGIG